MSCALHALKAGLKVLVFEARGLADGATGRNGGHQWPEEFGHVYSVAIENQDVKTVRAFIGDLTEEWQKRIDLRVTGALWPFCNAEEGDREFITGHLQEVIDGPLEGKFKVTDNDADLPESAPDGGYIAT